MFMMATNGSQLWDLVFITQAAVEAGVADTEDRSSQETIVKALGWLDKCQIMENPKVSLFVGLKLIISFKL
jgi:lanosterol synthase